MALVLSYTTSGDDSPTMDVQINIDTFREGADIKVVTSAICSFRYDDGFLRYPPYYASLNVWSSGASDTQWILEPKDGGNSWYASQEKTRIIYSNLKFTSLSNKIDVGFNITAAPGQTALATPGGDHYVTDISVPAFVAPTKPTWVNIKPSPCPVNQKAVITWGGATAGSTGGLFYDLEIRASKPGGGWTDWERLANAQSQTSYTIKEPMNLSISGQKPYLGIQYQFRVRSSDASYSTSDWVTKTLDVSFGNPTAPTSYKLDPTVIKKDGSVKVSWSGGSGGTGTISSYELQVRTYNHTTKVWSSWANTYVGGSTSYKYEAKNLTNGDLIQFRVRLKNSWGQYSSYLRTSSVTVRGNQMWIKINNTWKEAETYIKINGTWKEATPYIKINNTWKESI